ncbi:MAG: hypothetical protein IPJ74_15645 [Saprospiraceae bacterium]|nr:hypothetical protein [Saprospiraceae bacterium]
MDLYLKAIRNVTGYFTYDSQVEEAFDSAQKHFQNIQEYTSISEGLQDIGFKEREKPWWKFW